MNSILTRINHGIEKIIFYIIATFFAILVIVVSLGVLSRYILFSRFQWQWPEELSRLTFVWLIWFSGVIGCIKFTNIKLDYFFFLFREKIRNILYVFILLLIDVFLFFVIVYGIQMTKTNWTFKFAAFDLSQGYLSLALPICGTLMFYFNSLNLIDFIFRTYFRRN